MVKKYLKSLPITLIVVVVLLAIIVGVTLTGVNTWPFLFCLFYFTTFAGMKLEKVLPLTIWGLLGFLGGYLTPWLGATAGLIALIVYLILLLNVSLSGTIKSFDPFCFLMLTVTTGITGICSAESFGKDLGGFIAGVILMLILGLVTKAGEKKAAKKAAEAEKTAE